MQIGILEAKQGQQGTFFMGTLEILNDQIEVAMGPNPLKGQYEDAADFEFRFPTRNWTKCGNASEKTSKRTGMQYIKGAIVQQGTGTVYVNLYEVMDEKGKNVTAYNVHYTGDSIANARRRAGTGGPARAVPPSSGEPLKDSIPY